MIELTAEGGLRYVGFRQTPLIKAVHAAGNQFSSPIRLRTSEAAAELYSLKHATRAFKWLDIEKPADVPGPNRGTAFEDIMGRVESRYSSVASLLTDQYRAALATSVPPGQVVALFEAIASASAQPERGPAVIAGLERAIGRHALVIDVAKADLFYVMLITAVWCRQVRRFPLILSGDRVLPLELSMPEYGGSVATFTDLVEETHRVISTPMEEIEKAYRVWQISRRSGDPKPRATTPKYITVGTATAFLRVFARARTDRELSQAAVQRPAPVMFDLESAAVGLRQGAASMDSPLVIASAASSLMRAVERLQDNHILSNVVPSAGAILETVLAILVQVRGATYSDGDIVELGMELNTLQWQIDTVRDRIGDTTLGELTGLFSSAQMLTSRFRSWREFEASARGTTGADSEAYDLAVTLLESARTNPALLSSEADHRIDRVLGRAAEARDGGQQEGVVRSGENLAAITVEHVGRLAAQQTGGEAPPESVSAAMVKFVDANAASMQRLAVRRNRPWLRWIQSLGR